MVLLGAASGLKRRATRLTPDGLLEQFQQLADELRADEG
jgi:hypothetical protein